MNFETIKKELSFFYPVFLLEKIFSHSTRRIIIKVCLGITIVLFVLSAGLIVDVGSSVKTLTGIFFIFLSITLIVEVLDAFYFSCRFGSESEEYRFALASIVYSSKGIDLISDFMKSEYGSMTLLRAGIDIESCRLFLSNRKTFLSKDNFKTSENTLSARSYISALMKSDQTFSIFITSHGLSEETFRDTFRWVCSLLYKEVQRQRFWSAESLSSKKPIGREWSYGKAYALLRYSTPLSFSLSQGAELHSSEVQTLETMLSKNTEANILIIGDEGSGKMEIIEGLARKIARKKSRPSIADREFLVLSTSTLLSSVSTSQDFERMLIRILNEVASAGNIVLIIPDLPALLYGGDALHVDCVPILSPYLSSSEVHVIALSDSGQFHTHIENKPELMEHFDSLLIHDSDEGSITEILMEEVLRLEVKERVYFAYPSIYEAVSSAKRYFVGAPLYDTASDLLVEAVARARSDKRYLVIPDDIKALIKIKTGVPSGSIDSVEREKLQHLEELLHHRIIGQNEAIKLISDALRRARSGINNPNRPMGSFLFLGPTGVGKTETTKALAEIFFGQNAKILRLDMSEYNTPDALNRLIGGYATETPGVLSSLIRENPYGVLLLDEFEKTNSKVLDLFLQVLDEGIFSDALGRKVSARNLIIIATSNAGSQNIFDVVENNGALLEHKDSIIDSIVKDGIFKPELLNRFDGVVLFHPLTDVHLKEIAKILLGSLTWRLKDKGIILIVNDILIDFLVKQGSDPKFGARPLNRAIQDTVEKIIADKIIAGGLPPGSSIELSEKDLIGV